LPRVAIIGLIIAVGLLLVAAQRYIAKLAAFTGFLGAGKTFSFTKEYDLFEIRRSHLGNPGFVVGSEARFLLQGMNLALNLGHLVV
jgi:hypothetical protein